MQAKINHTTLELVQGAITRQDMDVIVNAANNWLLGGGDLDRPQHGMRICI